ncbi:FERM central domain-containing protein [Ditylenchus destructor]|uniref:Moesin/ezrin/radixin homolog 1 n=1 Tax=Ditylenchus destructor TaxID=166010 RepID=A0AAD4N7M4_9BILA|nr:FERM central domain-containing protein [Ditylenchus destructor]
MKDGVNANSKPTLSPMQQSNSHNSSHAGHNSSTDRSSTIKSATLKSMMTSPSASSQAPSQSIITRFSLAKFSPTNLLMGARRQKFLVNVQLLDDNRTISEMFEKKCTGQDVFDYVCRHLDITEKEYFGLRYQDDSKHRYWVDLSKPLSKQFHTDNLSFRFRVRFYPENPTLLREEVTRYYLFVQLQRDLLHGRLYAPQNEASVLAALILQSVLGDYDAQEMGMGSDYVSEYRLLLKQTEKMEEKIAAAHKTMTEMSPADAELEFLKRAYKIETYGFDPYIVKDIKQTQEIIIGANCQGLLIFMKAQKIHTIRWKEIDKVDYTGKKIHIYPTSEYFQSFIRSASLDDDRYNLSFLNASLNESITDEKNKSKKLHLKFLCPSAGYAKNLWRHILSQQAFFTEERAVAVKPKFSRPRIPLFTRGSTFRCPTSRVLQEMHLDQSVPRELSFERYPLQKQQARSVEEPWNQQNGHIPSSNTATKPSATVNVDIADECALAHEEEHLTHSPTTESTAFSTTNCTSGITSEIEDKDHSSTPDSHSMPGANLREPAENCVIESQCSVDANGVLHSLDSSVLPNGLSASEKETEIRGQHNDRSLQHLVGSTHLNGTALNGQLQMSTRGSESMFLKPSALQANKGKLVMKRSFTSDNVLISISACVFVALLALICYKWLLPLSYQTTHSFS